MDVYGTYKYVYLLVFINQLITWGAYFVPIFVNDWDHSYNENMLQELTGHLRAWHTNKTQTLRDPRSSV